MSPDSYYSHGFLIPFVSGYLIWQKRDQLKKIPPQKSWAGLAIILFAVFMHIFGTVVYIFSVSGFSILFLITGVCLFIYGLEITKKILFPLLFLIFMIPIPLALINLVSFPLKMLVANLGVKVVSMLGVPVFREGFNISIPQGTLLVGNPCSGLRTLITFLALGALAAYLIDLPTPRKWILFLLAIPIAIASNLIRVPLLILWSYKWGLDAAAAGTLVHTGSGLFIFILGILLLYFASYCLREKQ